tara:strand:- start:334 stop:594 length:261 start_codon:yes stop_codon:yes gene_type:complete
MDINQLIAIVKTKLTENIAVEDIKIEDKSFLHQKHVSHQIGKFHLKLTIHSKELKKKKRIESTKVIYSLLDKEMKKFIHSIQILIY